RLLFDGFCAWSVASGLQADGSSHDRESSFDQNGRWVFDSQNRFGDGSQGARNRRSQIQGAGGNGEEELPGFEVAGSGRNYTERETCQVAIALPCPAAAERLS